MMVQNEINPNDDKVWGKYASMFALCHICTFALDLGLNQLITKKIAADNSNQTSETSSAFSIKLISSVTFPILMIGLGYLIGYRSAKEILLLCSVSIIHIFIQFFGFFRAIIQGKQLFNIDAVLSNLDKALLIIFVLILLTTQLDILDFVYARILSIVLATVIILVVVIQKKVLPKPSLIASSSKQLIKLGLPFAMITLVYGINEQVDQVMIERLSKLGDSFDHAGIYSAAYRLVNAVMMYLWIVLPMFFAKFAHHETTQENKIDLVRIGTSIVFLPVAIVCILAINYGGWFFRFFFTNYNQEGIHAMTSVFAILCLSLMAQGLFAILSTYLTSNGHEKFVTKLVTISVFFNVITNTFLVPIYGAYAAAWTTLGSAVIVIIGYIAFILKNGLIKLPYITWIKLLSIALISFLTFYLLKNSYTYLSIIGGFSTFIGCIVVLKPIRLKELKSIR